LSLRHKPDFICVHLRQSADKKIENPQITQMSADIS